MATYSTLYINSTTFSTATAVFTDSTLSTLAADGFYSDGNVYRRQVNGILGDVITCSACADCFDISTASFLSSISPSSIPSFSSSDITWKPDGTSFFLSATNASSSNIIREYKSVSNFNINGSYFFKELNVGSNNTILTSMRFNDDGTKMFTVDTEPVDEINEYDLSVAYDISTATYSQNFSVAAQTIAPYGLTFNSDGTKFFLCSRTSPIVLEYTMSTGYDLSTASYSGNSYNFSSQDTDGVDIEFNSDGTKMFILGRDNDSIYEYTLSVGFDITSTVTYIDSYSISTQTNSPWGFCFDETGNNFYITENQNDKVLQYSLNCP